MLPGKKSFSAFLWTLSPELYDILDFKLDSKSDNEPHEFYVRRHSLFIYRTSSSLRKLLDIRFRYRKIRDKKLLAPGLLSRAMNNLQNQNKFLIRVSQFSRVIRNTRPTAILSHS